MAEDRVLNCPEVVAEGLTTIEPVGGVVLESAYTIGKKAMTKETRGRNILISSLDGRCRSGIGVVL